MDHFQEFSSCTSSLHLLLGPTDTQGSILLHYRGVCPIYRTDAVSTEFGSGTHGRVRVPDPGLGVSRSGVGGVDPGKHPMSEAGVGLDDFLSGVPFLSRWTSKYSGVTQGSVLLVANLRLDRPWTEVGEEWGRPGTESPSWVLHRYWAPEVS